MRKNIRIKYKYAIKLNLYKPLSDKAQLDILLDYMSQLYYGHVGREVKGKVKEFEETLYKARRFGYVIRNSSEGVDDNKTFNNAFNILK
jgi:hypothetical protein